MNSLRSELLSKFFERHGILANQYDIYKNMVIDNLKEKFDVDIPDNLQYCLDNAKTYEAKVSNSKEEFEVPMMTPDGYFVIEGIKKVPLIQESKSRNSMFFTYGDDIMCETRFSGSRNSMRLVFSNDIYIRMLIDGNDMRMNINDLFYMWDNMVNTKLEDKCYILVFRYMKGKQRESEVMSIFADTGDSVDEELYNYFAKHVLGDSTIREALYTIIYILSKCVSIKLGSISATDRDHCGFKIFHSSGHIISNLINRAFRRKSGKLKKKMEIELYPVMNTGSIKIGNVTKGKLVVQLGLRSTLDIMSTIRRVVVPADDNSTSHKMRQIHITQRGFICPSETPEGKQVGLAKNLSLTCVISPKMDDIHHILTSFITHSPGKWVVYNGVVIGFSNSETYNKLLDLKKVYPYMSVNKNEDEILIRTWDGRLMRPLIRTNSRVFPWNSVEGASWDDLLHNGIIEYVDPLEVDLRKIAKTSYSGNADMFTHMEIHPCTMFGISASTIPFINHNHGARSIFASSMIKQAMQCPPDPRVDGKYLVYSQKPLIYTCTRDILDLPPNGINILVCIMSFTGYNQEDAIIIKKSFAERGGFSSIIIKRKRISQEHGNRSVITQEKTRRQINICDVSEAPDNIIWTIDGNDDKIVNKYSYQTIEDNEMLYTLKHRTLRMGDKLSSRHAQKGVVGLIINDVDMPFTEEGIMPDILINPHGVPSRMTMGQMLEGLLGRRCSVTGRFTDGTPFNKMDVPHEEKVILTDGTTGQTMESYGVIDVVYYMALTHQVIDKIYIRSVGPRNEFSHQPVPGRSKEGGLRFGEMELDLLIAHGASSAVKDIIRNSDIETFSMCKECKHFPVDGDECRMCNSKYVTEIEIPYAVKVLKDLMLINNINLHL